MSAGEEMASYPEKVGKYYTSDAQSSAPALEPLPAPPSCPHPSPLQGFLPGL